MKWDRKINEDILTELETKPVINYIKHYQDSWRTCVNRMNAGRFLKAVLRHRPKGER
jgi:hypothetical protein